MEDLLQALLHDPRLARIANELAHLARPSLRIHPKGVDEGTLPLGTSKFGGRPDLPATIAWPWWQDLPLLFLAQFNLADIPALETPPALPSEGMLYFFYDINAGPVGNDPAERGGWQVFYFQGDSTHLRRVSVPGSSSTPTYFPSGYSLPACALHFTIEPTLPPVPSPYLQTPSARSSFKEALLLSEEEYTAYFHLLAKDETAPVHRLLGHPSALQGDMQAECQLVSQGILLGEWPQEQVIEPLLQGAKEWRLLLQLDSDPEAQMVWGIEGRCYFWIKAAELQAGHVHNTWFLMQWT